MPRRDDPVFDGEGFLLGIVYDNGGKFEAWARHRLRVGDTPGNFHKYLGVFDTPEEAFEMVATEEHWKLPHGHVVCPECNGAERDSDGDDCKLCNGQGFVAESSLR